MNKEANDFYIELGTSDYRENLCRRLSDLRNKEGLPVDLYELADGENYLVRCVFSNITTADEKDIVAAKIYNYYFAKALAEVIVQGWEKNFIKKVLVKEFNVNPAQIEEVYQKTCDFLRNDAQNKSCQPCSRTNILIKAIIEYLSNHQRFDIEGFMNFRAGRYKRELKKLIAKAVNEYTIEKEHANFIGLLKKFLSSQKPLFQTLHLVVKLEGEIIFYNDRGENINKDCLEENYSAISETIKNPELPGGKSKLEFYEDLLVCALLKCAPQQIVLHLNGDHQNGVLQLVREIFEENISYCTGCSLCTEEN